MKLWEQIVRTSTGLTLSAILAVLLVGCGSTGGYGTNNPPDGSQGTIADEPGEYPKAGDMLQITFADTATPLPPFEGRIKDDGTITLMENQKFTAAGKSLGSLEKEIHDRYVPRFFRSLTATVKVVDRYFYVEGQVRQGGGRYDYRSHITVIGAISAAGGLTEFADETKIQLIRANNTVINVNLKKAKKDPRLDPRVYPGDRINVPRSVW